MDFEESNLGDRVLVREYEWSTLGDSVIIKCSFFLFHVVRGGRGLGRFCLPFLSRPLCVAWVQVLSWKGKCEGNIKH